MSEDDGPGWEMQEEMECQQWHEENGEKNGFERRVEKTSAAFP